MTSLCVLNVIIMSFLLVSNGSTIRFLVLPHRATCAPQVQDMQLLQSHSTDIHCRWFVNGLCVRLRSGLVLVYFSCTFLDHSSIMPPEWSHFSLVSLASSCLVVGSGLLLQKKCWIAQSTQIPYLKSLRGMIFTHNQRSVFTILCWARQTS